MEKYEESFNKAVKELRVADHILYVTYHIVKDKRLLLKALDQEYDSLMSLINAILQYDYLWKRIQLYHDPSLNFDTFINKCSKRYAITSQEISEIKDFLLVVELHKKSPMEFMRREKVVIMADNFKTASVDYEKLKKYLEMIKRIIKKASFAWHKDPLIT